MRHQDRCVEVLGQQMLEWQFNFLWNGTNMCLRSDKGILSFLMMFRYLRLDIVLGNRHNIEQFCD